jgi:hypothetical protein
MKPESLGEVIAMRVLRLTGDESGKEVLAKIGKPCRLSGGSDYYCPYQLTCPYQ